MKTKLIICILFIAFITVSCTRRNTRSEIVNKIQKASKLSTTQFILSKYLFVRKEAKFFHIKTGQANFAAKTYAIVEAGIDMKKLNYDNIFIEGRRIQIKLPPVEIISFSYPPSNYEYLDQLNFKKGLVIFNLMDQDRVLRDADLQIRQAINYMNIRPIVAEKTKRVMHALLLSLGFDEVYITFSDENSLANLM